MRLQLKNTELLLHENHPLGLVNGRGITIRCVTGKAWLTVEGEAADYFLAPDQAHRLESNGLALVESLSPQATVRLEVACSSLIGCSR